jgi:ABC-type dipeptide/oligopeptide/nickel transport system ATPase component
MLQNKFRINRAIVKELLLDSFAAENFDVKKYLKTSIPYDWELINIKKVADGSYESTLVSFIETILKIQNHFCLIVIGDTGSGKSSSLKYAMEMSQKCHLCTDSTICTHEPMNIYVDFLNFRVNRPDYELIDDDDEVFNANAIDEFWMQLFIELDKHINITEEIEKNEFWAWILSDFKKNYHSSLYLTLKKHEQKIIEKTLTTSEYQEIKNAIYDINSSRYIFLIYKLLQIAFCRKKYEGACNLIVFDNLDSLEPTLQREALTISRKINEILLAKVIIPMRPHTFTMNCDGANFNEVMSHWSPDVFSVIEFRIQTMIDSSDEEVKTLGRDIQEVYNFIVGTKYAKDLFLQTCGLSVRFALRNFYNFLLSPLIYWEDGKLSINKMGRNEFYQAYFCSETDEQQMYNRNFDNIFSLKVHGSESVYSNIKLRILYFLSSGIGTTVRDVRNNMELFGYNDVQICSALNSMMRRRTPLIWSDNSLQYNEKMLSETHVLRLTPIGKKYFNDLIRDIRYMRECIVACDGNREKHIIQWARRCWGVFK